MSNEARAHFERGFLLRNVRPAEAVEHYRKALRIDPRFPGAHRELGWALWGCKRLKQAEAALGRAIRLDGNDAWAHNLLAGLLTQRGDWKEALAPLQAATASEPTFGPFWADLGEAYGRLGRDRQAEVAFKRALALGLDSVVSNKKYGTYLMSRGRLRSARRYLARAVRLDPSFAAARRQLARLDRLEERGPRRDR